MKAAILMLAVFLYVDKPVASLQFDLDTAGTVALQETVQKQIATQRLANGKLRVIIYGLNSVTFSGRFATVTDRVLSVTGVVGSDLSGANVGARVTTLSPPGPVKATLLKR